MLHIKAFQVNLLYVNCYVISDDTKEACIIDPGCMNESEWKVINSYIQENGLKPQHMLCTHLHFDHILGCGYVYRDYKLQTEANNADRSLYENIDAHLQRFGLPPHQTPPFPPIQHINENQLISFGDHKLQVIYTPGHSQGGVCFYCKEEDLLIAGDSLFHGSIGRTDFPESNHESLISALNNKILTLPDSTNVLCGHGQYTTIGYERQHNPFIN